MQSEGSTGPVAVELDLSCAESIESGIPSGGGREKSPQGQPSAESVANLVDLELTNWQSADNYGLSDLLPETSMSLVDLIGGQVALDGVLSSSSTSPDASCSWENSLPSTVPSLGYISSGSSSGPSPPSSSEFPDSYLLPVHELKLLKGMMLISKRIGCDSANIWSLDCPSPFNQGVGTPADQLPLPWRPTGAQVSVPHHPVVDLLPWPSARDRFLMLLELPDESRPPAARGPMALVNFVYDLEDGSEGVRIYGDDPCDPAGWEVGQVPFQRWWFLFDRDIIDTSNRWRAIRGAPQLVLGET